LDAARTRRRCVWSSATQSSRAAWLCSTHASRPLEAMSTVVQAQLNEHHVSRLAWIIKCVCVRARAACVRVSLTRARAARRSWRIALVLAQLHLLHGEAGALAHERSFKENDGWLHARCASDIARLSVSRCGRCAAALSPHKRAPCTETARVHASSAHTRNTFLLARALSRWVS
jgi:hypothetical protein